ADVVADDRRGLAEERPRLAQRRGKLAGERAQLLERRAELVRQAARLAQRRLGLRERGGELAQRAPERVLLGRECLEVRVRGVHQPRELLVAARERRGQELEVVDDALDVVAPLDQQPREALAVAGGRLEALERLAQVLLGGLLVAGVRAALLVVERGAAGVQQDL